MTFLETMLGQIERDELDALALIAAAASAAQGGRTQEAETLYRAWIEKNPDDALTHVAHFNHGGLLESLSRGPEAVEAYRQALRLDPSFAPALINLGNSLAQSGDRVGAVTTWWSLVHSLGAVTADAIHYKTTALKLLGRTFADADLDQDAEDALFRVLALTPGQQDILAYWLNTRQRQCKWPMLGSLPADRHRPALEAIAPLTLLSNDDDPIWHLARASAATQELAGRPARPITPRAPAGPADRRLRIGYLSTDLCDHAIGYLTVEIFGLHDRAKVEVFAYYAGTKQDDVTQNRIRAGVDHWRDVTPLDDESAARLIAADEIDILIDLNGHTRDARLGVLAHVPAPVIVNWLGYPGSMGSPYHHYIIADGTIIPPESEYLYTEKVLRLSCYQPTDRHRRVTERRPTRADAGLPEQAMVYCSFNDPRKLTEQTWNNWTSILNQVPDSVLWLLIPSAATRGRLCELAAAAGIDPARLVFADRQHNEDHLARYPLADLVIDNFPYGAHTTASDALWMGVPVLTLMGRSFPSRVCASLLNAAGLPDMICGTKADFIGKAVEFGRSAQARQAIKDRLRDVRDSLLFDTPRLVRELEALYRRIWEETLRGERPRPDLTNLPVYADIAVELALNGDREPDYPAAYRRALEERKIYTFLPPDKRLWPGE